MLRNLSLSLLFGRVERWRISDLIRAAVEPENDVDDRGTAMGPGRRSKQLSKQNAADPTISNYKFRRSRMIHRQIARRALGLVAAAVLAAGAAQAQTAVDGAVAGTVVDSSGAALPKAGVVVHSTATNADTKVTADASGYFRASRLVPGDYTVMVTAPGFSSYTAEHVIVEVGKLTEVMPKLGTGSASTTVEVTAENPVINQEQSDFTTEFNPTTLATLPINGRHWTSFALLSPGVTLGNSAFGLVSFRGSSNLQNNFLVDGVDDNDAFQSVERGYTRVGYSTPEDAILEFVVNTSNFSAINGRATGGGVNAVTRSITTAITTSARPTHSRFSRRSRRRCSLSLRTSVHNTVAASTVR
jgi:hypothetical protein